MKSWAVVWLFLCFGCLIFSVTRAQNVNINASPASCNNGSAVGIQCQADASNFGTHVSMTKDSQFSNVKMSRGYVFIQDRVRMMDRETRQVADFSCSFSFRITPILSNSFQNKSGDGMAFVMFANFSYWGNSGGTLGVYQSQNKTYGSLPGRQGTKTFCVEYDTFYNAEVDPNDNHVGVDLKNAKSNVTADVGSVGIDLKGQYPIRTWIDYNFSQLRLEVRIANDTEPKPAKALIDYIVDLSEIIDEYMHVGIAASTGGSKELHELFDLNFTTSGLPPPSPSPSPQAQAAAGDDGSNSKVETGMIVGVSVGGSIAVIAIVCLGFICMRTRRSERSLGDEDSFHDYEMTALDMPHRFTYKQLSVATNGFSEESKLGVGGSSSVYRGTIPSTGTEVAVKKVANKSKQGELEFLAEIRVVSRLRHRNLVKLLGWCSDRMNFLLVYELMPNGSLDKPLFQERGSDVRILTWIRRLAILRGVAAALAYLHEGYAQQVIHRDIKSSNVMLDQDFNARLGDFGLARLIEHSKNLATTQLAGTPGYIAPEAFEEYRCTDKTDVYAFGALCLEVACGRRPIDKNRPAEEEILVNWVWRCHALGCILSVVDSRLANDRPHNDPEIIKVLKIGLLCSHPDPNSRPSMREVELFLEGHLTLPFVPLSKPIAIYCTPSELNRRESRALALGETSPAHVNFSSRSNTSDYSTTPSTNRVHSAAIFTD